MTGLNTNKLITPKELSELFQVSLGSIYRLIDKRALPFCKVGGQLRFLKEDIDKYLSDVRIEPMIK